MKCDGKAWIAATAACMAVLLSTASLAAESTLATDVALRPGGLLMGQVVNPQGVAQAGTEVSIQFNGQEVVRTTTDESGVFAAQGLRGGQYQIQTKDGVSMCRLWAADTAPPAARPAALVVSGTDIVRGAPGYGPMHHWVTWMKAHPYITAGTVAAAVAIPVAFADDDDPDHGS